MFAEVAPAIPLSSTTSKGLYTYRVPRLDEKRVAKGSRVTIPIGRRTVAGTIVRLHTERVPYSTKTLTVTDQPPLTPTQWAFAEWLAVTMRGGLGYTLRLFFPSNALAPKSRRTSTKIASLTLPSSPFPSLLIEKNTARRAHEVGLALAAITKHATQALILVPEVHLIEPLRKELARQQLPVETYHSERTARDLTRVWHSLYQGKSHIIIGTQKALFLPWRQLSHVVIESEYLETHKLWDQYPRLDNRYGAQQLAAIHGSTLTYSSPTLSPLLSVLLSQPKTTVIKNNPLVPKSKVTPLTYQEQTSGHLFPADVINSLKTSVRKKEKVVIFHNQRGSWRSAICSACHKALRCPECHSTVFVTGASRKLRIHCRQCSYQGPLPERCPNCQSKKIRIFGPGTTRISSIIRELLPKARVLEIVAGREPAAKDVAAAHIIIGTSAIFSALAGHKIHGALWLFPEITFLYPDFRSSERAWSFLVRLQSLLVPRRPIMLVTRHPGVFKDALTAAPERVMNTLLRERAALHYPPYTDLVKITVHAKKETTALDKGRAIRRQLDERQTPDVYIRGPYQGFNKKEGDSFAVHLLLAGPLNQLVPLYKDLPIDRADLSPANIL